jgi:hypothetical protein
MVDCLSYSFFPPNWCCSCLLYQYTCMQITIYLACWTFIFLYRIISVLKKKLKLKELNDVFSCQVQHGNASYIYIGCISRIHRSMFIFYLYLAQKMNDFNTNSKSWHSTEEYIPKSWKCCMMYESMLLIGNIQKCLN